MMASEIDITRRLADYKKTSGIIWIIIGIIQTLAVVLAIAGIWNIFVGVNRLRDAKRIVNRDPAVLEAHQAITGLVIIGLVNLIFGAIIGVVLVGFDFYIRGQILKHRHAFESRNGSSFDDNKIAALEQLSRLREQGILSEAEFVREKDIVMGS